MNPTETHFAPQEGVEIDTADLQSPMITYANVVSNGDADKYVVPARRHRNDSSDGASSDEDYSDSLVWDTDYSLLAPSYGGGGNGVSEVQRLFRDLLRVSHRQQGGVSSGLHHRTPPGLPTPRGGSQRLSSFSSDENNSSDSGLSRSPFSISPPLTMPPSGVNKVRQLPAPFGYPTKSRRFGGGLSPPTMAPQPPPMVPRAVQGMSADELRFTEQQWESEMEERKRHERVIVISGLAAKFNSTGIARDPAVIKAAVASFLYRNFAKLSLDAVETVQEVNTQTETLYFVTLATMYDKKMVMAHKRLLQVNQRSGEARDVFVNTYRTPMQQHSFWQNRIQYKQRLNQGDRSVKFRWGKLIEPATESLGH